MKKFLLLYLKTGGGHISNARSLQEYFINHHSSLDVVLGDGLEKSHILIKKIMQDGYAKLQSNGQSLYEFLYACNKTFVIAKINQILMSEFTLECVKGLILKEKPTHIVVFHFFLVKPVKEVIESLGLDIVITTIVTDPFTVPRLWFLEKEMKYIVYSDQAKKIALGEGIDPSNVVVFPPILNQKFDTIPSSEFVYSAKIRFGLDHHKKTILLFGGGDGLIHGSLLLEKLLQMDDDFQVLMICGNNTTLYKKATTIAQEYPHKKVNIYGFVDFVYDLLAVSDLVITKAGPATLLEILHMGKIPLITNYLWEQEKGNVEYILHNRIGFYEKNINKMIEQIHILLHSDLSQYHQRIKHLHLENGVGSIAEYLLDL